MGPDKLDLDFKIYYAPELSIPGVERIKFHGPATIIFWKDGTKTVVKCQEGDEYNSEKGVLFCVLKKLIGLDKINHILELAELAAEEELSKLSELSKTESEKIPEGKIREKVGEFSTKINEDLGILGE